MSHQFLPTGDNLSLMMIILEVIVIIQVCLNLVCYIAIFGHIILCIYTDHKKNPLACAHGVIIIHSLLLLGVLSCENEIIK